MEAVTLREQTGVALSHANQTASNLKRTQLDFIMALGGAEELGIILWDVKYGGKEHLIHRAYQLLLKRMWKGESEPHKWFAGAVHLALEEWSIDICLDCNGRGWLGGRLEPAVRFVKCTECHGSGSVRETFPGGKIMGPLKEGFKDQAWVSCPRCAGMKKIQELFTPEATKQKICPTCKMTGRYVRTDKERAAVLGLSGVDELVQVGEADGKPRTMRFKLTPEQEWEVRCMKKFNATLNLLQTLDHETNKTVREASA